jgi:uncharacterized protein YjiK
VALEPTRVEDVPVRELSSLAVARDQAGAPQLLAIGDRTTALARATLRDGPLEWELTDLRDEAHRSQFEGLAVDGGGRILVLREAPPAVLAFDPVTLRSASIALRPGGRSALRRLLDDASSAGEGLLSLGRGRLLVAKEKDPPMLVEFGPPGATPAGISAASFAVERDNVSTGKELEALAAWRLDEVDDVSDLTFSRGLLYCLSDKSRQVVAVELPLEPESDRARVRESWKLKVPERSREPKGKPEGLVVTDDGSFVVGLDTRTPRANLCWYRPD